MLAELEANHLRELHHDFRYEYHVRYEDVPVMEACDLVMTLSAGSLTRQALMREEQQRAQVQARMKAKNARARIEETCWVEVEEVE